MQQDTITSTKDRFLDPLQFYKNLQTKISSRSLGQRVPSGSSHFMSLFCRTKESDDGQSADCPLYSAKSFFRTFQGCLLCSPEAAGRRNALWFVSRAFSPEGHPIGCKGFGPTETNLNLEAHQAQAPTVHL